MKNIYIYYLAILLPLLLILFLVMYGELSSWQFVGILVLYSIYRDWTDGLRLLQKGVISKWDIPKLLIPFYRFRHFKALYLSR